MKVEKYAFLYVERKSNINFERCRRPIGKLIFLIINKSYLYFVVLLVNLLIHYRFHFKILKKDSRININKIPKLLNIRMLI